MKDHSCLDKKTLILEGNIGAGKSTMLKILNNKLGIDVVYEPTDRWQEVGRDGNLLDLFYKDIKRWAYTFQSFAFITRVQIQIEELKKSKNDVLVFERSVYCDRYCFAKNCYESKNMTALEWQIYKEWFSWLVEGYTRKPDGFIYLKTDPQVCFQRLKKRSRSEESEVTLNYLQSLHKRHEDWLVEKIEIGSYLADVPVLVLDCDCDFEQNLNVQQNHVDKVADFVAKLEEMDIKKKIRPVQIQL